VKQVFSILAILVIVYICPWLAMAQDTIAPKESSDDDKVKIETEYNPSKDETTVSIRYMKVSEPRSDDLFLTVQASYGGHFPATAAHDVLVVLSSFSSEGFKYPHESILSVQVSGRKVEDITMTRLDFRRSGEFYLESLGVRLKYERFLEIVRADEVQMRLVTTTFTINAERLEELRTFAKLISK
jgi:hypothetical protein